MTGPGDSACARVPAWVWALGYVTLALPFVPLWPDFETARRGLGSALGGAAFVALVFVRGNLRLSPLASACWLGVVAMHVLSSLQAANPGDACARCVWLASLWGFALLAARASDVTTQLEAVIWAGLGAASFGLAQALGLAWPLGYSVADDPVSTLGNRNVAAEFVTLAVAAAAVLLVRGQRAGVPAVTVVLGVAYLWVNHSRSGLLASGITLAFLVFAPLRAHAPRQRFAVLGLVVLGLGAGWAARQTRPAQVRPASAQGPAAADRGLDPPSTVAVRLEIWTAGLQMMRAAPWLGVGAGQFKVHYPRFRSQHEIELSTRGRQFAAAPLTAHDDPLEIGIEAGVLGLALYLGFLLEVARCRRGGVVFILPIAAFAILSLVRSPLANAPAAAFAFACAGALCATGAPARDRPAPMLRAAGLLLGGFAIWVGARECAGQCAAAPHLGEERKLPTDRQNLVQMHALDRAVWFCPWDTQLRAMRAALRFELAAARNDLAAVRELMATGGDYDILLQHTPFHTTNLRRAAHAAQALGERATTRRLLEQILSLDPPNPEARLFLATELTLAGDAAAAVATLYAEGRPHPRLRRELAQHLRDLAAHATAADQGALLSREAAFLAAVDALAEHPAAAETMTKVQAYMDLARAVRADDLRPLALFAVASVHRQQAAIAVEAGDRAPLTARLAPAHAALLGDVLAPLRALPRWDSLLRADR